MKQNWILVGAVTAMLAASTGLRAQDATTTTTPAPMAGATTTTGAAPMSGTMSGDTMGMVDYTMLNSKTLDYTDLIAAKARGLSEDQVATVAKIAEKTGMPFRDITDAVIRGETFSKLADMYNLKLQDVMDASDEKTKIASYKMTYEMTGWKNVGMMGSGMSDMSGGSMSSGGGMGTNGAMSTGTTSTTTTGSTTTTTGQ